MASRLRSGRKVARKQSFSADELPPAVADVEEVQEQEAEEVVAVGSSRSRAQTPSRSVFRRRANSFSAETIALAYPLRYSDETAPVAPAPAAPVTAEASEVDPKDKLVDEKIIFEFGGPVGVTFMMILFPLLMYYLWACVEFYDGVLARPSEFSVEATRQFFKTLCGQVTAAAAPTWKAAYIYLGYIAVSAFFACIMPGPVMKGLRIPSENGKQLEYKCNGVWSFVATLVLSYILHKENILKMHEIVDNFAPIMTVAILSGFAVTILVYSFTVIAPVLGKPHRMSGHLMYDLFMGAPLNPRLFNGALDLKMWAEIRVPWIVLFYVTLSAAFKEYNELGAVSSPMCFMVLAHFLYVNACMKGEECIPTSWDIFYEKFGFMLIFWNLAGVPFTYCISSLYILKKRTQDPTFFDWQSGTWNTSLFVALICAYYVWDTANAQKNRFRMMREGTYFKRNTFPQLPWSTLDTPEELERKGQVIKIGKSVLLVAGWWGIARKIHYTADLVMALSWGLITGVQSFVPYFYFCFFLYVLVHRVSRDMQRCSEKYGPMWKEYCARVPYIFIPGIF